MTLPGVRLYGTRRCVWCLRVRIAAARLGIDLEEVDVDRDPGAADDLAAATGRRRVPALRIDGGPSAAPTWIVESGAIVRALRERVR
jgi:glutathione S-transferase